MGRIITNVHIDAFVQMVNDGSTGLIGLQLSRDGVTFEIGELNVVDGQDVRVFSTAEGATVRHTGPINVATGGMLTIGGTIATLEFAYTETFVVAVGAMMQT